MSRLLAATAAIALAAGFAISAHASLVLTAAGIADNFTMSVFAGGFPEDGSAVGPIGVGFLSTGQTIVASYASGQLVEYPNDNNGQTFAGGTVIGDNYGTNNPVDFVTSGGKLYLTLQQSGELVQVNSDGTLNHVVAAGLSFATGAATNPNNGHIFVSEPSGGGAIFDVDPVTGNATLFLSVVADGLTVSPDGKTLYAEVGGHILGYNIATKAQVFDSGFIFGADGAAAATGALTGELFVNTNFGGLFEVNETTDVITEIADSGTRGDIVTIDPNDGSLLLSQSTEIDRLSLPAGSSFSNVPEPASLILFGSAFGALALARRRKQRKS